MIPPHPLTIQNFEIQKYCQNEPKYNGVYSRSILPEINEGVYIINLDETKSIGTYWMALYVNANNVIYISVALELSIPKGIKRFIVKKNTITNIYRMKAYDCIICEYFCIWFTDFMLREKFVRLYKFIFS